MYVYITNSKIKHIGIEYREFKKIKKNSKVNCLIEKCKY